MGAQVWVRGSGLSFVSLWTYRESECLSDKIARASKCAPDMRVKAGTLQTRRQSESCSRCDPVRFP